MDLFLFIMITDLVMGISHDIARNHPLHVGWSVVYMSQAMMDCRRRQPASEYPAATKVMVPLVQERLCQASGSWLKVTYLQEALPSYLELRLSHSFRLLWYNCFPSIAVDYTSWQSHFPLQASILQAEWHNRPRPPMPILTLSRFLISTSPQKILAFIAQLI